jgi:Tn7-like transposition protein D/TniQ
MKGNHGGRIHTTVGISASNIKIKRYFMHCEECIKEDFKNYGETFWHRTHQLPGVYICHKHNTVLHQTEVFIKPSNQHEYVIATEDTTKRKGIIQEFSEEAKLILFKHAQLSHQLLQKEYSQVNHLLYKKYKSMLMSLGLCSPKGYVNRKELYKVFQKYFSQEVLRILESPIDDLQHNWFSMFFRKHRISFHPIRHLLVLMFFNEKLEDLFGNKDEFKPFGKGPWRCLNPACESYKNKCITDLKITRGSKTKKPVGTFVCVCGFIYSRTGPDKGENDSFRIGRIKAFGNVWMDKLKELIQSGNTLRGIARELECDPQTIKKQAILLGIPFSWTGESLEEARKKINKIQNNVQYLPIITNKEKEWAQLQKDNSESAITQLRSIRPDLYAFLYRNSSEFLIRNSLRQNKKVFINSRVNWIERDKQLLNSVQQLIKVWEVNSKKLTRITPTTIGKKLNKQTLLRNYKEKLPKTYEYIKKVEEDIETFQIRRLHWTKSQMENAGKEISAWKLKRKAGLGKNISNKVKREIILLTEKHDY